MFCFGGFFNAWSSQACVGTYRCVIRDGRAVSAPCGSAVVGSRFAFLPAGRSGKSSTCMLTTIPCFDSLVVVAASWGLMSVFGWDFRSQAAEGFEAPMSMFEASGLTTEPLKGRGVMLSNCLRGKGKKAPLFIALGRGEGR